MAASCGSFSTASARISIPGDHRQDIVEIMRDAAGELADGFHLLGLAKPVLRRDLVSEVAQEAVEHESVAAFQRGDAQFDLDLLAVTPLGVDFDPASEDVAFSGAQEAVEGCRVRGAVSLRNDQFSETLAQRLVARPPEYAFRLGIPV
jgi:hypothetical protein